MDANKMKRGSLLGPKDGNYVWESVSSNGGYGGGGGGLSRAGAEFEAAGGMGIRRMRRPSAGMPFQQVGDECVSVSVCVCVCVCVCVH